MTVTKSLTDRIVEQPSRQETGGGETREEMYCDTCGGRCDGLCEEGDEQFEQACRDRAKAKAAEQAPACYK